MIEKALVVDDEPLMLRFVSDTLTRLKIDVERATNGLEACEKLKKEPFDLIISDVVMPHKTGLEVLAAAKEHCPGAIFVLMTAHGSIESAVDAMKKGAFNYLIKPFSPEALEAVCQKAEEHARLFRENQFYKEAQFPELIAVSPSMQKLVKDLSKIARSHATVFITGESGTGKEVIAQAIHSLSTRASGPFVKVNCAAIPETLVESEFFGHEKGAFTGALARKQGRLELAHEGTLLFDEVTEIPPSIQAKLLRAIQEQEFERVGGTRSTKVNVRFLATSNRNMEEAIETKAFREDLFYRLNVVPLHIPPLRERPEDILPLAEHFLRRFAKENHKAPKPFTDAYIDGLLTYHWPGNVRELANRIERAVVLDFEDDAWPKKAPLQPRRHPFAIGMSLYEVEKRLILETLEAEHQNRTRAAAILGISVRTLRNKLQEYGSASIDDGED
ncbi:MAG: hypothetical protein RL235_970 [Chlamydiota bacterium]|jgi:two-component system response regulator AtoC